MVIAAALGILVSCAASRPADMDPGEKLFKSKCGACHIRPKPGRFTRSGWEKLLDEHKKRVPLEPDERQRLLDYLARDDL